MNKVILMGRLTKNPEVRYSQSNPPTCIARYTLAVDRRFKRDGEASADFIPCVTFGKNAEFVEKYLKQGSKIVISGRIQTGSYTNRDGNKVYTTDIVVEEHDFAESKNSQETKNKTNNDNYDPGPPPNSVPVSNDGFMTLPEGIEEELPFI